MYKNLLRVNKKNIMKNCQNCAHFRSERSLRNTLGLAFSLGTAQALNSLQQNEFRIRDQEEKTRNFLYSRQDEVWPSCPKILSYCGLKENLGQYLVHELKNADENCSDFISQSQIPPRSCESCRHYVQASGYRQQNIDLQDILSQGTLTGGLENMRSDPSRITRDIDILFNSSQSSQSSEITEAMYSGGKLSNTPKFFDWCRKYSTNGKFSLCNFENHDGRCHGWQR